MSIARRAVMLGIVGSFLAVVALGSWLGAPTARAQAAPELKVDPAAGKVGTTVRITGQGFCGAGCSAVQLSFAGIVVADGIKVDSDGGFVLSVTVPGGIAPGEKAVAATQTNATGQQLAAIATFQVTLGVPDGSPSPSATGSPSATPTGSATPSPRPTSTAVVGSPAVGGGGSSSGWIWAMVVAAAVFLAAVLGIAYVLWRSRETPVPPPAGPPFGPLAPHEEVVAALTPAVRHPGQGEGEAPSPPAPGHRGSPGEGSYGDPPEGGTAG